jgi:hypothetical protein
MKNKAATTTVSRRNRTVMWIIIAVAAALIAYGSWLGSNISVG